LAAIHNCRRCGSVLILEEILGIAQHYKKLTFIRYSMFVDIVSVYIWHVKVFFLIVGERIEVILIVLDY